MRKSFAVSGLRRLKKRERWHFSELMTWFINMLLVNKSLAIITSCDSPTLKKVESHHDQKKKKCSEKPDSNRRPVGKQILENNYSRMRYQLRHSRSGDVEIMLIIKYIAFCE